MPEVSDTWLKINYWFLTHKKDLRKWWVIILLAVDVFFVIFVLTNFLLYVLSISRETRLIYSMASRLAAYQEVREKNKPKDLEFKEIQAIPAGYQNIDVTMKVKNPNEKWAAKEIKYKFIVDGNETEAFENFILPNEEKYIFGLSVEYNAPTSITPKKIEPKIEKINWQRVKDIRKYPEVKFEISNINYSPVEISDKRLKVINLTADVKNNSIYDFWEAGFNIVLYSGSKIVAVNQISIERFKAFEIRQIFSRWTDISENITEAAITSNVNILDSEIFMQ